MDWYYERDGTATGPVSADELRRLADDGVVSAATQVAEVGATGWIPYTEFLVTAGFGAVCSQCARQTASERLVRFRTVPVCADCKPDFLQRLREGLDVTGERRYAGFWIRVGARMIDSFLLGVFNTFLYIPMFGLMGASMLDPADPSGPFVFLTCGMYLIQFSVAGAYDIFFVKRYDATPGKMICRLRVVRSDGESLSWGRATGRYFGYLVSSFSLGIGFLMAAFDSQKRALHDQIADTRVVRRRT